MLCEDIQRLLKSIDTTIMYFGKKGVLESAIRDGSPGHDMEVKNHFNTSKFLHNFTSIDVTATQIQIELPRRKSRRYSVFFSSLSFHTFQP